jgi:hypothetical protein
VERARQELGRLIEFVRTNAPARHPLLAILLGDVAEFERNQGNPDRALMLIREALEIGRQSVPTHPYFIDALVKCGQRLAEVGRFEESESMFLEALESITLAGRARRDEPKLREVLERVESLPSYRADPSKRQALRAKYA